MSVYIHWSRNLRIVSEIDWLHGPTEPILPLSLHLPYKIVDHRHVYINKQNHSAHCTSSAQCVG